MKPSSCRQCHAAIRLDAATCPRCGCDWPTDPFLGRTLRQNILIEEVIGSGGMGNVYRGMETHLERPVAVKVLHRLGPHNDRHAHYFMREARVLSRLRHPNIVSVLDFGKEPDGTLFLIMEFIPGRTLEQVIRQDHPLDHRRALRILIQVAAGLQEAHGRNIVHRDLKPSNIILEEVAGVGDFAKVLDFGIAKTLRQDASVLQGEGTELGTTIGTPEYMSPEQAQGEALDARTDIYSLGLILFELLTRSLPFQSENVLVSLMKRTMEDAPPPSTVNPAIPAEIDRICLKALQRAPEDRFPDVQSLRHALERALEGLDNSRSPIPTPRATSRTSLSIQAIPREQQAATLVLAVMPRLAATAPTGASTEARRMLDINTFLHSRAPELGASVLNPNAVPITLLFPPGGEDHSLRVARAALELRDQTSRRFSFARFHIGLSAGPVTLNSRQQAAGAALQAATLRARDAGPNQILLDPAAAAMLQPVAVLGAQPGGAELLRLQSAHTQASGLAIIGRPALQATLEEHLHAALQDGRGAAVALVGPSGVGRTHAALAMVHYSAELGLAVLHAIAHPQLIDRPFRPLLDLAMQAAGLLELPFTNNGPQDLQPQDFERGLILLGLTPLQAAILTEQLFIASPHDPLMRGLPDAEPLPYPLVHRAGLPPAASQRARHMTLALRALLTRVTSTGPALVVLEDVHHADAQSLRVLPALAALCRDLPLLLVFTSERHEPVPHGVEQHTLGNLQGAALTDLWTELRRRRPQPLPHDDRAILAASGGLPFYLVRYLESPPELPAPPDLDGLLTAQIAALPNRLRRLLLITSVIGEFFETSIIEGLFPRTETLGAALQEAADAGILRASLLHPEIWRFRSPLIHSRVYDGIAPADRARFHARIVEVILQSPHPVSRWSRLLATQHALIAQHPQAARDAERLGDTFAAAAAWSEALPWYDAARAAAPPRSEDDLLLKSAAALLHSRRPQEALERLHDLQSHDGDPFAHATALEISALLLLGDASRAGRVLQAALRLLPTPPIPLLAFQGVLLHERGMPREALQAFEDALRALQQPAQAPAPLHAQHLAWLVPLLHGRVHARLGNPEEAERSLHYALRHAISLDAPEGITASIALLATLWLPQRAELLQQRCHAALHSAQINLRPIDHAILLRLLGRAEHFRGHPDPAHLAWRRSLALAVELDAHEHADLAERLLSGQNPPEPDPELPPVA